MRSINPKPRCHYHFLRFPTFPGTELGEQLDVGRHKWAIGYSRRARVTLRLPVHCQKTGSMLNHDFLTEHFVMGTVFCNGLVL